MLLDDSWLTPLLEATEPPNWASKAAKLFVLRRLKPLNCGWEAGMVWLAAAGWNLLTLTGAWAGAVAGWTCWTCWTCWWWTKGWIC